jgi:hypothetical protein
MKNIDFIVAQYRAGKLVRTFVPSGEEQYPWKMLASGRIYLRTSGWVLSKILPTLLDGSSIATKVIAASPGNSDPAAGVK